MATAQELALEPKGEIIQKFVKLRQSMAKHRVKERAKHGANVLVGAALAGVGGVVSGGLSHKMPVIPKTQVRTDLALGGALSLAAAANLFDGVDTQVNDIAKGLIGAGLSRMTESFLIAHAKK
jgi:hypothetical protein